MRSSAIALITAGSLRTISFASVSAPVILDTPYVEVQHGGKGARLLCSIVMTKHRKLRFVDITDKEYTGHRVFSELERYADFYDQLSMSVMSFVTMGTSAVPNIDTFSYSSIQGTLESIKATLSIGRINDAFALLRKYHDSIVINVYANLYLKDHFSLDNFVVKMINDWLNGEAKLPEYRIMSQYLRKSADLRPITQLLFSDERYKRIRVRCNDNSHYNFYQYVMLNDSHVHNPYRIKWLNRLAIDLRDLFILHFAYVFWLHDHYMTSSDYVDALECNIQPEQDSQYWVAPFVQEMFDQVFRPHRPDLYDAIKEATVMKLK